MCLFFVAKSRRVSFEKWRKEEVGKEQCKKKKRNGSLENNVVIEKKGE